MSTVRKKVKYGCDFCHYYTDNKYNLDRHYLSESHKMFETLSSGLDLEIPCSNYDDPSDSNSVENLTDNDRTVEINQDDEQLTVEINQDDEQLPEPEGETFSAHAKEHASNCSNDWFPYESKAHLLLSAFCSSRTHHVSDEVLSFILFILRECGVTGIPSLGKLKNFCPGDMEFEEMLQKSCTEGNIHWSVKPSEIIKMKLANPQTSKKIARYPTISGVNVVHHQSGADKWTKHTKFHWAEARGVPFVLGSFVQFTFDQETVIGKIVQFFDDIEFDKMKVKVDVYLPNNHSYLVAIENHPDKKSCLVRMHKNMLTDLHHCSPYQISDGTQLWSYRNNVFSMISDEKRMGILERTNLWRGHPIVTVPVNLFIDDLSANKSKRWAPLHAVQMQLAGHQVEEKRRGKNVHYLSSSEKVGMTDLLKPICNDIQNMKDNGIQAFDAGSSQECIVTSDVSLIVSDYNMMSLACNHLGPSANKFCPKCMADKSDPFGLWGERTKPLTMKTIERLKIQHQKKYLEKRTGVKNYENCLWNHLDPHKETPIGLLHFLYLGLAKHLIQFCYSKLPVDKRNRLALHLESIDQTGFAYKINASTFFAYLESRQGKDFKHYLQLAPINFEYAGLQKKYIDAISKLALVSKHIQENSPTRNFESEVNDYVDIMKKDLQELANKKKSHFCTHLSDDIKRHGHPLNYVEDQFEKNHGNIRANLFHENGHAKSRDTAMHFIKSEVVNHVIDGGFFKEKNQWVQASESVKDYAKNDTLQKYLGVADVKDNNQQNGTLKSMVRKEHGKPKYQTGLITKDEEDLINMENGEKCIQYNKVVTQAGTTANVNDIVLYETDCQVNIGQIYKLVEVNSGQYIFLKKGNITKEHHQIITLSEHKVAISASRVRKTIHVVHDCKHCLCTVRVHEMEYKQEQERTTICKKHICHKNVDRYIVNKFRFGQEDELHI